MLRFSAQTQQSKVRAQLEQLLRSAQPGSRLPSEPVLAKQFEVSRTTIREVMGQLEAEGFVTRRQGRGTYVNRQPLIENENLLYFVDFPTLIEKEGYSASVQQLGFLVHPAGAFFAERFQVGPEEKIITRQCVYRADDQFCVLAEDCFPAGLITDGQYHQLLQSENTDLRLFLFMSTGRMACQDETTISVVQDVDYPFLKELLNGKDTALLFISSICLDRENRPIYCSQIYNDTDYIKYHLNRKILQ